MNFDKAVWASQRQILKSEVKSSNQAGGKTNQNKGHLVPLDGGNMGMSLGWSFWETEKMEGMQSRG